jgi:hypothetical protein
LSSSSNRSPDELVLALSGPLGQWLRAVENQRRRLDQEGADGELRQADAALFAVAVRNVVRVVRAVAVLRQDPQLDAAVSGLDAIVPGARNVRGLLDHADDYAARRGKLRRKSYRATTGHRVLFERTADRSIVFVGELAFDVDVVTDAVRELAEDAFRALDRMAVGQHRI